MAQARYMFGPQSREYTPETAEKMQAVERRQQLVNALIEQGMQPKQTRQAGRFVVAPSMIEQLSGPLSTLAGAISSAYLDKERGEIQKAETERVAKAYQDYQAAQADVPEWKGRTVPGTGSPAVDEQPSNLEDIIAQRAQPSLSLRKPAADVAEAMVARQYPQQIQTLPEFDGPVAQPPAYRPGTPAQAAVPDRRETVDEALDRVGGFGTAQSVKEGVIDPGPIVRPDLAAAISEANRPDQAARPLTPAERSAADMNFLATGVPGAWPLVELTMKQREADLARAETIAERRFASQLAHQDRVDKNTALVAELQWRRDDKNASREEKAWYNQQLVDLRQQGLDLQKISLQEKKELAQDKADAPKMAKQEGRKTLSGLTSSLREMYYQLAQAGGITDPSKSTIDNILPYLASTMPGQIVGKAVGSKTQSIRNSIESTRPLLLQAIAAATGIKPSQLNSNEELRQYLLAATSTSNDLHSNMVALGMLDKLYGLGPVDDTTGQRGRSSIDDAMKIYGGR